MELTLEFFGNKEIKKHELYELLIGELTAEDILMAAKMYNGEVLFDPYSVPIGYKDNVKGIK